MTEKKTTTIQIFKDCSITINPEKYYKIKNKIDMIDEQGNTTPSRILQLENECWLIIPEKLVPKETENIGEER